MSSQNGQVFAPLPKTHYFLTVSRGTGMRTFAVRVLIVHLIACVLPLLGVLGAGASAYVLFHDDVVASLMARQSQMQYAYEDRLDAMRGELQRQTAHQSIDRAAMETRLGDLLKRESRLEGRTDVVASLADLAGLNTLDRHAELSSSGPAAALPPPVNPLAAMQPALRIPQGALGFAAPPAPSEMTRKPRPVVEPAASDKRSTTMPESLSALDAGTGLPLSTRLSLAAASLDKVERMQVGSLMRLGSAAREETARLESTLDDVGLSSDRFGHEAPQGQGGPFVPLAADRETPFGEAMANLQETLTGAARLRAAFARVPLADPLAGVPEVTSPFGARVDPFLGRPALHTGVDLKESFGAEVRATAAGRVVFAGVAGGYGNMVEIDHGSGLLTRYAHMEEILVTNGQTVERDGLVGRVGSTGRATGPHLHYEIRVDNEPVDPLRFINVGMRLAELQRH